MAKAAAYEIIGRDEELEVLRTFVASLGDGPAAAVVAGDAGIGKTTLWRAGLAAARERSFRVLAAAPAEAEAKLSFAALGDLLGPFLDEVLSRLPTPQRRALEIALLLEEAEGPAPQQHAIALALQGALRALADRAPLVVAIDDVQWLDPASARVLQFVSRRLSTERVGLLLAERDADPAHPPLGLEGALPRERLISIPVGPLTLGALRSLIHERLNLALTRPILLRLHEASGGNPFFALEIARALERGGAGGAPGQPLPVPHSLGDLVRGRVTALPTETQECLLAAAALSKPRVAIVQAAIGGDAGSALGPGVDAQVITLEGDRIRFTHPLLAAVAYECAPPARRCELHGKLAHLVTELEERAHHLAITAGAPDEKVALTLEAASRRAASRGAPDAAADLCAHSRLLTPPGRAEALRRRALQEAEYAMQSGDTPRACAILEGLLCESPSGRPRAEVLTQLARVQFNGLDWTSSIGLLEEASVEAGEDVALHAQIELHLALNLDLLRTNVHATLQHALAAVDLAERTDDATVLAEALALEAKSEFLVGQPWPHDLIERALALEPAMAGVPPDRWPSDYVASMLAWTDDLDGALAGLERTQRVALEQGEEVSLVWTLARIGEVLCRVGAWDEALGVIERGYEIAVQAGQRANQAIFVATEALVKSHLGLTDSAREAGERALELAEPSGAVMARRTALSSLGFLELSRGHPAEADAYLAPLAAETRAGGIGEPGAMRFLPDEIEALVSLGRVDEAEELLVFFEERATTTGRISALAAAGRCHGLLHAARGKFAAALAVLADAVDEHERAPMPFERARTLLVLGEVKRRTKQKRAARESLERALVEFERLGARLWAQRARAELARIGGRAPAGGALTPTEQRVAALVAEGRATKEVAALLFLSPKTVEGHLSRIYAKLGVHSRAELAASFADRARIAGS